MTTEDLGSLNHMIMGTETEYGAIESVKISAGKYRLQPVNITGLIDSYLKRVGKSITDVPPGPPEENEGFNMFHPYGWAGEDNNIDTTSSNAASRINMANVWLKNGGRFYLDTGNHPEVSTPECRNPWDVVRWEKAGEFILNMAREEAKEDGKKILIFKNNSDGKGNTWGYHENYLIRRMPADKFVTEFASRMIPFLVARQVYTGAGKVGIEERVNYAGKRKKIRRYLRELRPFVLPETYDDYIELEREFENLESDIDPSNIFQLSQRADFITEPIGSTTTEKRAIFNTKDEPHANRGDYRRLHIICGDANMSEMATYLKIGTTALVVRMIEDGLIGKPIKLENPVAAFKEISRNPRYEWIVKQDGGKTISAVDILGEYFEIALDHYYKKLDRQTDEVIDKWGMALHMLKEPLKSNPWFDWSIKRGLLGTYISSGLKWSDPKIRRIDLGYHDIDRKTGFFYRFALAKGLAEGIFNDNDIEFAASNSPNNTRAWFRGNLIEKFGTDIRTADWEEIIIRINSERIKIDLRDPFAYVKNSWARSRLKRSESLRDLLIDLKLIPKTK